MAYTVTKIHTYVLILLIILRSNMYNDETAADGEVGGNAARGQARELEEDERNFERDEVRVWH